MFLLLHISNLDIVIFKMKLYTIDLYLIKLKKKYNNINY
jgi:hypothetical protein